ncbi:hypothetical protein [Sorangium sp. So ce1000]|uniref:hypothetical protein n=1 Tax=Sorangium sp. So ce1000 TaxID=3133325 RepID=UPI003F61585D
MTGDCRKPKRFIEQAEAALAEGQADVVVLAHALLDDPRWTYHAAKKLGMDQSSHVLLPPYGHWLKR